MTLTDPMTHTASGANGATGSGAARDDSDEQLIAAMNQVTDTARLVIDNALSRAQAKTRNLEVALATSRTIGMALGIIIERCRLSPEEAFTVLRQISQRDHRKLRDVASELVFTGVIPHAA